MDPDSSIIMFAVGFAAAFFLTLAGCYLFYRFVIMKKQEVTEESVKQIVQTAGENDVIDAQQQEMIDNIFELSDVTAFQIMSHRTEIAAIEVNDTVDTAVEMSVKEGFSRLPVYEKTLDNIIGILYIKDLLPVFGNPDYAHRHVSEYVRPAIFVPEAAKGRQLLLTLREKHTHMAIVVDEYGGTSGLVTMEDLLEQIVGNIFDEYDDEDEDFQKTEDGVLCDGGAELEQLFEYMELEAPEQEDDEEFETVSGLIIEKLGRIPSEDETVEIEYGGIKFAVRELDERRIKSVFCSAPEGIEDGEED